MICRMRIVRNELQYLWLGIFLLLIACNSEAPNETQTIEPQQSIEATAIAPIDTTTKERIVPEREMEVSLETKKKDILPPPPPPPVIKEELHCVLPPDFDKEPYVFEEPPVLEEVEEIFTVVEEMPIFPGCDSIEDYKKQKSCGDQKMLTFIYDNINYPTIEKGTPIEGMAVVSFVVNKKGRLENIKVLRNPGGGLGAEAVRVIELMNTLPQPWSPGKNKGALVNVKMNLPIRFKLK